MHFFLVVVLFFVFSKAFGIRRASVAAETFYLFPPPWCVGFFST